VFVLAPTNAGVYTLYKRIRDLDPSFPFVVCQSATSVHDYDYGSFAISARQMCMTNIQVKLMTVNLYLSKNTYDFTKPYALLVDEASLIPAHDFFLFVTKAQKIYLYGDPKQNDPYTLLRPVESKDYVMTRGVQTVLCDRAYPFTVIGTHTRFYGFFGDLIYNFFYSPIDHIDTLLSDEIPLRMRRMVYHNQPLKDGNSWSDQQKVDSLIPPDGDFIVVTPYKSQCAKYRGKGYRAFTTKSVQGYEADTVIIDLVRWTDPSLFDAFGLKSFLVMLTRARKELIFYGDLPRNNRIDPYLTSIQPDLRIDELSMADLVEQGYTDEQIVAFLLHRLFYVVADDPVSVALEGYTDFSDTSNDDDDDGLLVILSDEMLGGTVCAFKST
jgi:hypothetical protein